MDLSLLVRKNNALTDGNIPDRKVMANKLVNALYFKYEQEGERFKIAINDLAKLLNITSNSGKTKEMIMEGLKLLQQPIGFMSIHPDQQSAGGLGIAGQHLLFYRTRWGIKDMLFYKVGITEGGSGDATRLQQRQCLWYCRKRSQRQLQGYMGCFRHLKGMSQQPEARNICCSFHSGQLHTGSPGFVAPSFHHRPETTCCRLSATWQYPRHCRS